MPREVFVAGQILTAAEMNIVSDQTVMTFAGTAARGSAIPTPSEGMAAYLSDSNIVSLYDGADWKNSLGVTGGILQVVSTTKTDTFSTTSTSFTDVTGLSATITPTSATSKILLLASVSISGGDNNNTAVVFERGGTLLGQGNAAGDRIQAISSIFSDASIAGTGFYGNINTNLNYLDSPATVSSTEYFVQIRAKSGTTSYINRSGQDINSATYVRSSSTITLMEVAG